jgi:hypothetical protein
MTRPTTASGNLDAPFDAPPTEPSSTSTYGRTLRLLAVAVALTMVALVGADGAAAATSGATRSTGSSNSAFGTLRVSRVTGQARNGARFVGHYQVNRFVTRHHRVMAVGRLTGNLTRRNGAVRPVSRRVRMPLNLAASRTANTTLLPQSRQPSSATPSGVAVCNVLNLVLGPLDLNLLGLVVHLNRVVLNITAVPGAGALLGNLLCAVAGLLDGAGLGGLNAILTNLLNALLGILQA